jgi:transcriptional regulator with XRE-family HTH domain
LGDEKWEHGLVLFCHLLGDMNKSQRELYAESFADYVIEALQRTRIKQAELARLAGIKPQTVSKIVGKKPHSLTGKLLLPSRETVEKIAQAFGDPVSLAREAAGYSTGAGEDTIEGVLEDYFTRKRIESPRERVRLVMGALEKEFWQAMPIDDTEMLRELESGERKSQAKKKTQK